MPDERELDQSPETIAAHAGDQKLNHLGRPGAMPLYQTVAFMFESIEEELAVEGTEGNWRYYRMGGPNQTAFEQAMAELEGAEAALATASGMGAIFGSIATVCGAGAHIIADKVIYGVTYGLLVNHLPRFNIETTFVDTGDPAAVRAAMRPSTKVLYFETINNPLIGVSDLAATAKLGRELGLTTIIDSTFVTPYLCQPVKYGVDVVIHATTKYIGGHSDAIGGMLLGSKEFVDKARTLASMFGLSISPFDSWLYTRSLKTLPLRMQAHSRNAQAVAEWLSEQPKISRVYYPGLKNHPQHTLARKQFPRGMGGMLSFELKDGDFEMVSRFVKALKIIPFMPSLADTTTTINYPAKTSHRMIPPEERQALGVTDGLLRLSVGIEDPEDIIADLEQALAAI